MNASTSALSPLKGHQLQRLTNRYILGHNPYSTALTFGRKERKGEKKRQKPKGKKNNTISSAEQDLLG
jgi:hypothetical protein